MYVVHMKRVTASDARKNWFRLLDEVATRPITRIIVNSNGVTIARDDELLERLRSHNKRVEIYLQFDGFRSDTYLYHRNADLSAMKTRAAGRSNRTRRPF